MDAVVAGFAMPIWTVVGFTVVAEVVFIVALMAGLVAGSVVFPVAFLVVVVVAGVCGGIFRAVFLVGIGGFIIIIGLLIDGLLGVVAVVVVGTGVVVGFLLITNSASKKGKTSMHLNCAKSHSRHSYMIAGSL